MQSAGRRQRLRGKQAERGNGGRIRLSAGGVVRRNERERLYVQDTIPRFNLQRESRAKMAEAPLSGPPPSASSDNGWLFALGQLESKPRHFSLQLVFCQAEELRRRRRIETETGQCPLNDPAFHAVK